MQVTIDEAYGPGDPIKLSFSTERCFPHRNDCTNPEGHDGQHRLGTNRCPHVEMSCVGKVQMDASRDLVPRFAFSSARREWGDRVCEVYQVEDSVFEAVNEDADVVGYVLKRGSPQEYLNKGKPWVFLKVRHKE